MVNIPASYPAGLRLILSPDAGILTDILLGFLQSFEANAGTIPCYSRFHSPLGLHIRYLIRSYVTDAVEKRR